MASAVTLNESHLVGSDVLKMWISPFTVLVLSSKVSSTVVQSVPALSSRSARITVAASCVAFPRRSVPAPGSASAVEDENV